MNELVVIGAGSIVLIGAVMAITVRDRYQKLIYLSLIVAGVMPFLAEKGYLDVLTVISLIVPISTFFILLACRRNV